MKPLFICNLCGGYVMVGRPHFSHGDGPFCRGCADHLDIGVPWQTYSTQVDEFPCAKPNQYTKESRERMNFERNLP